jgi:hypothetical protein
MRRTIVVLLLSLAVTPLASAAGWKKAYFGATKPGTWARYVDHSSDPDNADMTVTMTRLTDDEGRPRIETKMDSGGKYPLMLTRYTMKSTFNVDRDLIDYGPAIVAGETGTAEDSLTTLDANTVKIIAGAMLPYSGMVFKSSEVVDGKKTDRYSYTMKRPGDSVETGDLWLSDSVPFGIVRNTFTIKEAGGKSTAFERKLVASGAEDVSPVVPTARPAAKSEFTLKEAYDGGLIRIDATVDEAAKNGEQVHLRISAKEDAPSPLTVTVPKGKTSLHVDMPLDDFIFEVSSAQTLQLTAEKSADLDVRQTGAQRAMKGKFQISMYEGTPLWSGSATIGWVK